MALLKLAKNKVDDLLFAERSGQQISILIQTRKDLDCELVIVRRSLGLSCDIRQIGEYVECRDLPPRIAEIRRCYEGPVG